MIALRPLKIWDGRSVENMESQRFRGHDLDLCSHVTSSITWPLDSQYVVSYRWSFEANTIFYMVAEIFCVKQLVKYISIENALIPIFCVLEGKIGVVSNFGRIGHSKMRRASQWSPQSVYRSRNSGVRTFPLKIHYKGDTSLWLWYLTFWPQIRWVIRTCQVVMYYPPANFGDDMSCGFVLECTQTYTHVYRAAKRPIHAGDYTSAWVINRSAWLIFTQ